MLGLLVLPKERYYANIQDNMIDADLLLELAECVAIPTRKIYSLKYIVRRIRNAIAHFHIECKADKYSHEIDTIVFSDYDIDNNGDVPDFQISLSVNLANCFLNQFSEAVSNSIAEE